MAAVPSLGVSIRAHGGGETEIFTNSMIVRRDKRGGKS